MSSEFWICVSVVLVVAIFRRYSVVIEASRNGAHFRGELRKDSDERE